jgi:hypothetical protein
MRLFILAIVLMSSTALAQSPGETPRVEAKRKNLLNAYLVSIAATSIPLAVGALATIDVEDGPRAIVGCAALVFGPSAGHWYVGRGVTTGLVLRGVAAAAVAALVISDTRDDAALILGGLGALAVWETGVIWDMVTLPRAVRRYNKAHALTVAPLVGSTGTGSVTGLAVGGAF